MVFGDLSREGGEDGGEWGEKTNGIGKHGDLDDGNGCSWIFAGRVGCLGVMVSFWSSGSMAGDGVFGSFRRSGVFLGRRLFFRRSGGCVAFWCLFLRFMTVMPYDSGANE